MATGMMSDPTKRGGGGIPGDTSQYLESVLPGFSSLSSGASSVINSLLQGLPSVDSARTSNAYFGAGSGLGSGSEFLRNRGYDLYNQQAEQRRQTGVEDLLKTIAGYSGSVVPTAGQALQNTQFGQSLGEQKYEFGQNYELNKFQALLQALGLANQMTNSQIPIPTLS